MGISFGSASKKPYVGSKEVQEAYVGSQLVYKSGLPYNYYFLGGENDYFINDNVKLMNGTDITKPAGKNTYKITSSYINSAGYFDLKNANQFVGWKLKFTYCGENNLTLKIQVDYREANFTFITRSELTTTSMTEQSYSFTVPAKCDYVRIAMGGQIGKRYFDNIRFEEA